MIRVRCLISIVEGTSNKARGVSKTEIVLTRGIREGRTDDDSAYERVVQHPPRCDVRDAHAAVSVPDTA